MLSKTDEFLEKLQTAFDLICGNSSVLEGKVIPSLTFLSTRQGVRGGQPENGSAESATG